MDTRSSSRAFAPCSTRLSTRRFATKSTTVFSSASPCVQRPKASERKGTAPEFDELWNLLLRDLRQDETRTAKSQSGKTYQLSLSSQGNVLVNPCEVDGEGNVVSVSDKRQTASKENARLYWRHPR